MDTGGTPISDRASTADGGGVSSPLNGGGASAAVSKEHQENGTRACEAVRPATAPSLEWFQPGDTLAHFQTVVHDAVKRLSRAECSTIVKDVTAVVDQLSDRRDDEMVVDVTILPGSERAATTNAGVFEALESAHVSLPEDQRDGIGVADHAVYVRIEAYIHEQKDREGAWLAAYPGQSRARARYGPQRSLANI